MSNTADLLGCPFCGGRAWMQSNRSTHQLFAEHADTCLWSGNEDAVVTTPATDEALASLTECWNTRATLPAQPEVPADQEWPAEKVQRLNAVLDRYYPAQPEGRDTPHAAILAALRDNEPLTTDQRSVLYELVESATPQAERKALTDAEIVARCKAAGIEWLEPDDHEDGFPGAFDLASMTEMRNLLSGIGQPAAQGGE